MPDVTVKVHVWLASLVGPELRPVRKLAFVIAPASSAIETTLVLRVKLGASFTAETVSRKLFVEEAAPSFAISVMLKLPFMLVFGVKVSVTAALVRLTRLVEVIATSAMFVSEELTDTVTLVMSVSESSTLTTAVLLLDASSRIVLETSPVKNGASFCEVTPMLKVFVIESIPPLVVPPLSFITTVIVRADRVGRRLEGRLPLVLIVGART